MHGLISLWRFWAVLAAFAAVTAILAKIGVAQLPSDLATLVRTAVVVVLAALVVVAGGSGSAWGEIRGRTLMALILVGIATGASWLCYFQALKLGRASQVAPLDKLSAAFVAVLGALLLGALLLGERLSASGWLGIGLIVIGAVLVARDQSSGTFG